MWMLRGILGSSAPGMYCRVGTASCLTCGTVGQGCPCCLAHTSTTPAVSEKRTCITTSIHVLSGIGEMMGRSGLDVDHPVQPRPFQTAAPAFKRNDNRLATLAKSAVGPYAISAAGATLNAFSPP